MEQSAAGKKIFILYPHSVIQDELLDILIMAGFESYILYDHKRALKLLEMFPDSIMFINIDDGMNEKEWESYIMGIMENPKTKECRLGILSYNTDQQLMQKYLMEIAVPCGYIQLKLGVRESTKIMLGALEANEARGRRRSIRADCGDDLNATLNYRGDSGFYHGKIMDISSAGVTARMDRFDTVPLNTVLRGVQLKLRGGLFYSDMIFMGKRKDSKNIYIMLFDPKIQQENKMVIIRYIKMNLQKYIDSLKL